MRIAITGGIAEGKSTVLNILREMRFSVASADEISRTLFKTEEVNHKIAQLLGVPAPVDPAFVRDQMLNSHTSRRAINRLLHKPITEFLANSHADFEEVPLLFEACLNSNYDQIWVVTCGKEEQQRRLLARYGPDFPIDKVLSVQLNSTVRAAFADRIIRTNMSFETVKTVLSTAVDSIRV